MHYSKYAYYLHRNAPQGVTVGDTVDMVTVLSRNKKIFHKDDKIGEMEKVFRRFIKEGEDCLHWAVFYHEVCELRSCSDK